MPDEQRDDLGQREDDEYEYLPAGEVLNGLELLNLDPGWTPMEVTCAVKCIDEDGDVRWVVRSTPTLNCVEAFGGLSLLKERVRGFINRMFDGE